MNFNPLDYDTYHVGVSGGKDSTAVLLWLRYESGWPLARVRVTFCDTQNEDPLTYSYLAMLAELTGLPIEIVEPEHGFLELAQKKKRFPSPKARFCTQMLKIVPSGRYLERLRTTGRVLLLSGIRQAEGTATNDRGDLDKFGHNDTYQLDQYLPVYDWTLQEVWDIHARHIPLEWVIGLVEDDPMLSDEHKSQIVGQYRQHRVPRNPLYDMGAARVGCFPCMMSRKREVRAMAKFRPERIDEIAEWEQSVSASRGEEAFSSFFARTFVPLHHRTQLIVTSKDEEMRVASIRDVVRWSHTGRFRTRQYEFDFSAFDDSWKDEPMACDYKGACE